MKKFASILGFFILVPIVVIILIYSIACCITWCIIPVHVEWGVIRVYVLIACVLSFFMSLDKDL
jgi:hypothetical protein